MWSVPFNFNIHDSYFAVGMIFNRGKFTSSSYWFNQVTAYASTLATNQALFVGKISTRPRRQGVKPLFCAKIKKCQ
jgi:hypothetical protein